MNDSWLSIIGLHAGLTSADVLPQSEVFVNIKYNPSESDFPTMLCLYSPGVGQGWSLILTIQFVSYSGCSLVRYFTNLRTAVLRKCL